MRIEEILEKEKLTRDDLITLMKITDSKELDMLYKKAYEVKTEEVGRKIVWHRLPWRCRMC